tara:strand:- start:184 stop:450 length:267 start_codon:yes stop_codon:yes gene_type:complete
MNLEYDFNFPGEVKRIRKKLGLSQVEFAKHLGYGDGVRISEIENGSFEMSDQGKTAFIYLMVLIEKGLYAEDYTNQQAFFINKLRYGW